LYAKSLSGLKTLKLEAIHFHGSFPSVGRDLLLGLPATLETIDFAFLNAELCWLTTFTSNKEGFIDSFSNPAPFPFRTVFPRLHTLRLNGNMRHMQVMSKKRRAWCWRALLAPDMFPSSLTHLTLVSCNRIPCIALAYLPTSLQHLHLSSVSGKHLGAWIQRLPALRVLMLPIWSLSTEGDGFLHLPKGVTEIKMRGAKENGDDSFLASALSQLPQTMASLLILQKLDNDTLSHIPKSLTKLDIAVARLALLEVANLPRTLTHLSVRLCRYLESSSISYLPPSLKNLELPNLDFFYIDLCLLPTSLTALKLASLRSAVGQLPQEGSQHVLTESAPASLESIVLLDETWQRSVPIWKFPPPSLKFLEFRYDEYGVHRLIQWWKLGDPTLPWFEEMHGWTSWRQAVEDDSPETLERLLARGFKLYGCRSDELLGLALQRSSEKILTWLERNGFDMAWSAKNNPELLLRTAVAGGKASVTRLLLSKWDEWFPDQLERVGDGQVDGYAESRLSEDESENSESFPVQPPEIHSSYSSKITGRPSQDTMIPSWPEDGFWDSRRRLAVKPTEHLIVWTWLIQTASEHGSLEVLEWLLARNSNTLFLQMQPSNMQNLIGSAAKNHHWHVVKWLYEHRFGQIDMVVMESVLNSKAMDMLEWMKIQGVSILPILKTGSKDKIRDWLFTRSLPILKWLKQEGCQVGPTTGLAHFVCTYVPSPEIAHWLHTTFNVSFDEPDPGDAVFRAYPVHIITRTGNFRMLQWLQYIGANLEAKDAKGKRAIDIAHGKKSQRFIDFLSQSPTSDSSSPKAVEKEQQQ
jgi:hypothetical protein